jgi:hypothetical protein
LTTNYPALLPETVDDAIDKLMMVLYDEQKATLATMQKEDLIALHFSLCYLFNTKYILY